MGAADKRGKWLRNGACLLGATAAAVSTGSSASHSPGCGRPGTGTSVDGSRRWIRAHRSIGNCISRPGGLGYQPQRWALREEIKFD